MWNFLSTATHKVLSSILTLFMVFSPVASIPTDSQPVTLGAGTSAIRQEVNITDGYLFSPSGAYATSSAVVGITDGAYTNPTYYFEAVASTTGATTATISLVNATSSKIVATITMTGGQTSYARLRSTAFMPNASSTVEYRVVVNNEAVGKGLIASRIVVLQDTSTLSQTETQIEIGAEQTYTGNATSTLSAPKYWYYDSTHWDATTTVTAEVTYNVLSGVTSATSFTTAGWNNATQGFGTASTSVQLWGGGGAGGGATLDNNGGGGGAGGQYASSTLYALCGYGCYNGADFALVVGATTAGGTGNGTAGTDSTWALTSVVAKGGAGGTGNNGAGGSGSTTSCVGDFCFAGGNGASGVLSTNSGAGGGGAGTGGTGGNASGITAGTGTANGGGTGGAGLSAGANANGNAGNTAGGGGGGAYRTITTSRSGGGGAIGKGYMFNVIATTTIVVQESDGTGDGFQNFTDKVYIVTGSCGATGKPSEGKRCRSNPFVPISGRNYRLAFKSLDSRQTFGIYNAKIIVTQYSGQDAYVVAVGGGGAGGSTQADASSRAGGGGSGGMASTTMTIVSGKVYRVTVGAGGVQQSAGSGLPGNNGGDTLLDVYLNAHGGGGGGAGGQSTGNRNPMFGNNGATGGGTGAGNCLSGRGGGLAIYNGQPYGNQGFSGGQGGGACSQGTGGGGGGAGAVGSPDTNVGGTGNGGAGVANGISGASVTYGTGGKAGGGSVATANTANSGNGGDGATGSNGAGEVGLTGTVVISAPTGVISSATGCTQTSAGGRDIWTCTTSQTWTPTLATPVFITKVEPQYALSSKTADSGTALQNYFTSWNSAEWTTTNAYYTEVDSADNGASVVELDTAGGVILTNSTVASPDNRGRSISVCMPANGDLTFKATTNNNDIYAVSIIVAVGITDVPACGAGATPTIQSEFFIE